MDADKLQESQNTKVEELINSTFGQSLAERCVESILSFTEGLYAEQPIDETCTTNCVLYAGQVGGCRDGILLLENVDIQFVGKQHYAVLMLSLVCIEVFVNCGFPSFF